MAILQHRQTIPVQGAGIQVSTAGPVVQIAQRKIRLGGVISTRAEAEELIAMIDALKTMLKDDADRLGLTDEHPEPCGK